MKCFYKRVHFTLIYRCYIWLERLLNSEHFCDNKGKQILNANLHGNQQSSIIYANMQIKIRISRFRYIFSSYFTYVTFHAKTYTNDYPLNGQKLTANGRLTSAIWKCSNALPNVSNGRSNISNGLRKRSNGQLKKSNGLSKCSNGQLQIS